MREAFVHRRVSAISFIQSWLSLLTSNYVNTILCGAVLTVYVNGIISQDFSVFLSHVHSLLSLEDALLFYFTQVYQCMVLLSLTC